MVFRKLDTAILWLFYPNKGARELASAWRAGQLPATPPQTAAIRAILRTAQIRDGLIFVVSVAAITLVLFCSLLSIIEWSYKPFLLGFAAYLMLVAGGFASGGVAIHFSPWAGGYVTWDKVEKLSRNQHFQASVLFKTYCAQLVAQQRQFTNAEISLFQRQLHPVPLKAPVVTKEDLAVDLLCLRMQIEKK